MNFLVDGYNYLHRARLLRGPLEGARRRLAERLRVLARKGDRVTIVWDARRAPPGAPDVEVSRGAEHIYARRAESADDEIVGRLRHADDPRRYCVISDDREVTRAAKQLGAAICSVGDAEARIAAAGGPTARPAGGGGVVEDEGDGSEKPRAPKGREVQEWLELFGEEKEPPAAE